MAAKASTKFLMGPVGWAMFAFDVVNAIVDSQDLLGFEKMLNFQIFAIVREQIIKEHQKYIDENEVYESYPNILSPIDKLTETEINNHYQKFLEDKSPKMIDQISNNVENLESKYELNAKEKINEWFTSRKDFLNEVLSSDIDNKFKNQLISENLISYLQDNNLLNDNININDNDFDNLNGVLEDDIENMEDDTDEFTRYLCNKVDGKFIESDQWDDNLINKKFDKKGYCSYKYKNDCNITDKQEPTNVLDNFLNESYENILSKIVGNQFINKIYNNSNVKTKLDNSIYNLTNEYPDTDVNKYFESVTKKKKTILKIQLITEV